MTSEILLETERLQLRRFTQADAGHLTALDADPEVMRFLTGGAPTPREVIEREILPRFCRYDPQTPELGYWAAIERSSGQFLGWLGLTRRDDAPHEGRLGYRLRRATWGKGYATEGSRALLRIAFTHLRLQRVVATTYEDNLASRRVMEKIGMRLVRRFRMTPEDLAAESTYEASSQEIWDGDDVEYALERTTWEIQEAALPHNATERS